MYVTPSKLLETHVKEPMTHVQMSYYLAKNPVKRILPNLAFTMKYIRFRAQPHARHVLLH